MVQPNRFQVEAFGEPLVVETAESREVNTTQRFAQASYDALRALTTGS